MIVVIHDARRWSCVVTNEQWSYHPSFISHILMILVLSSSSCGQFKLSSGLLHIQYSCRQKLEVRMGLKFKMTFIRKYGLKWIKTTRIGLTCKIIDFHLKLKKIASFWAVIPCRWKFSISRPDLMMLQWMFWQIKIILFGMTLNFSLALMSSD